MKPLSTSKTCDPLPSCSEFPLPTRDVQLGSPSGYGDESLDNDLKGSEVGDVCCHSPGYCFSQHIHGHYLIYSREELYFGGGQPKAVADPRAQQFLTASPLLEEEIPWGLLIIELFSLPVIHILGGFGSKRANTIAKLKCSWKACPDSPVSLDRDKISTW